MSNTYIAGKRIVLGVSGSIAAYKAADLASKLTGAGAHVTVALTHNATQFVTAHTFRAVTGRSCLVGTFDEPEEGQIAHIAAIEDADLYILAPATANLIAKLAHGICDDMVTTLAVAAKCPMLVAPAMNSNMWSNPIVIANVDRLKAYGFRFVEPAEGRLACGMTGPGKLADIQDILAEANEILRGAGPMDLAGSVFLITAGPTREPIDPVRYISNYSSGRMGFEIARNAYHRGAKVLLVTGPSEAEPPAVDEVIRVETAAEMLEAVNANYKKSDVIISAAAVADFTPTPSGSKVKKKDGKGAMVLEMNQTEDILASLGKVKEERILVGFALESDNLEQYARQKLAGKNLDMIVANSVDAENQPFGNGPSRVRIFTRDGKDIPLPLMSKQEIADQLVSFIRDNYLSSGNHAG